MNGASAYIREFDAVNQNGQPTRMTAILLQGPISGLQVMIGINLYQWSQFVGPALQFVAGIQLAGTLQGPGAVRAFMDHEKAPDVKFEVVSKDGSATRIATLPAKDEKGQSIVNNYYYGEVHVVEAEYSGNFSDSNNQFGDNSVQNVGISPGELREITSLLGSLRAEIQRSPIPAAAKARLEEHVETMNQAAHSGDVKSGFTSALKGINEQLAQVETAGDRVSGIVSTLGKIAGLPESPLKQWLRS